MLEPFKKKALSEFASSDTWVLLKEEVILPLLNDIKDVTKPIKYGDITIPAKEAQVAKFLAATQINELIYTIDFLRKKSSEGVPEDYS